MADATVRTYVGIDYGLRRVGIAVADSLTRSARPVTTLPRDFDAILDAVRQWQPAAVVVGLPLTAEGGEQEMTATARRFARRLAQAFGGPVRMVDERMSSLAAQAIMRDRRRARRGRRLPGEDAVAASVILQQWLDHHGEDSLD